MSFSPLDKVSSVSPSPVDVELVIFVCLTILTLSFFNPFSAAEATFGGMLSPMSCFAAVTWHSINTSVQIHGASFGGDAYQGNLLCFPIFERQFSS